MKSYSNAKQGDVIGVRSIHGNVYAYAIVTDKNATGHVPGNSGYECRTATPAEVSRAQKEGNYRTEYNG